MNMRPRDLALIILCCVIWGFTFVTEKRVLDEIPPLLFTAVHYLLMLGMLFPFIRWEKGQMPLIFATALTTGGLYVMVFFSGFALTDNVSLVAIAVQMEIPFTTLLAIIFLGEHAGWRRMTGLVLCVVGVIVLSFDSSALEYSDGLILVLISALIAGTGTIFMRSLKDVDILNLLGWTALFSLPMIVAGTLLFESDHIETLARASWVAWGGVGYGVLIAHLFGVQVFYYLLYRYDVSLLITIISLVPVFGVVFGVSVYGDQVTQQMILGGLTVLAGTMVIIEREKARSDGPPTTDPDDMDSQKIKDVFRRF